MRRAMKKTTIVLLSVFTALCVLILVLGASFLIADSICEKDARIIPSYEKIDLTPLIEKEEWTDEDYETIYRQTGLGRAAAEEVERSRLTAFQEALFFEGKVEHTSITPVTSHDNLVDPETGKSYMAPIAPLQKGDILLSSTTHMFGWRHGHAALVAEPELSSRTVFESVTIGEDSGLTQGGDQWFRKSSNFLVLRLKGVSEEERAAIADRAVEELSGIPYNIFVGYFSPKNQCKNGRTPTMTHCSHLVWQSYLNAGYDIDFNGGPLCKPSDIARSPLFEVVQVYGFDLDKLW